MSGTSETSPHSSPNGHRHLTRTVGIIKNHALKHRMTIERRIIDSGFDIVKERQMEFSPDSDREVLEELFGNDASALTEAPVWVYVLERHRAIETLHALMGSEDPAEARENEPQSLRAIYGQDIVNNAFGGSIDSAAAEAQISALFASSPVFSSTDLPPEGGRDIDPSVLDQIRNQLEQQTDAAYYADSVRSNGGSLHSSTGTPRTRISAQGTNGKPVFRARPVPATNAVGAVSQRLTKAAALRMGLAQPSNVGSMGKPPPTGPTTEVVGKKHFIDTPGHKRSSVIAVASTAPPTIAPRATKASALREGKPIEPPRPARQSLDSARPSATFLNVHGHKRSDTIEVASVKEPTVKPRTNRSASLRQTKDNANAPPSSYMFRGPTEPRVPSALSTRRSSSSLTSASDNEEKKLGRRSSLSNVRPASSQGIRTPSSIQAPEIAPRSNRSAMLRAAKMAATPAKPTRA
ncbi:hypothetical protein CPB86DRAFT_787859 [Serendipita vermifera]|nr:hypothetical protein CPB86DRAFT_787859 [Serendipita vermifera]